MRRRLDPFRAPLTPSERARRRPEDLDPRRRALLDRWGYPHVFEAFRFHMTLTGRLADDAREAWRARLAASWPPLTLTLTIDAVTLLRPGRRGAVPHLAAVSFRTVAGVSMPDRPRIDA